jgi:hypothetical protein
MLGFVLVGVPVDELAALHQMVGIEFHVLPRRKLQTVTAGLRAAPMAALA